MIFLKLKSCSFNSQKERLIMVALLFTLLTACTESNKSTEQNVDPLIGKGKTIYLANCISCHNINPKLPGAVGPEVAFASQELIEQRIMHAKYPQGYTPKRKTQMMVAMPQLKDHIPALTKYLNSL